MLLDAIITALNIVFSTGSHPLHLLDPMLQHLPQHLQPLRVLAFHHELEQIRPPHHGSIRGCDRHVAKVYKTLTVLGWHLLGDLYCFLGDVSRTAA